MPCVAPGSKAGVALPRVPSPLLELPGGALSRFLVSVCLSICGEQGESGEILDGEMEFSSCAVEFSGEEGADVTCSHPLHVHSGTKLS